MVCIKERYDPINHFGMLIMSHVAARGQAQPISKEALIDAGTVIGRACIERLHVHWLPKGAGFDLIFQQHQADIFSRYARFAGVDGQGGEPACRVKPFRFGHKGYTGAGKS